MPVKRKGGQALRTRRIVRAFMTAMLAMPRAWQEVPRFKRNHPMHDLWHRFAASTDADYRKSTNRQGIRAMRHPLRRATLAAAVASAMAVSAAQAGAADLPVAADQPYPGTLTLHVDLSDASRHLYHVHETVPVGPG